MNIPEFNEIIEPNDQTEARKAHLESLRGLIGNVYPNKFDRTNITGKEDTISNLLEFPAITEVVAEIKQIVSTLKERERPAPELKDPLNARLKELGNVRISGRLATPPRIMGKAAFVHLSDGVSRLQVYCRKDDFVLLKNDGTTDALDAAASWDSFNLLDHGDFIGVEGYLFITNTGELSVHVEKLQFLSKAMLPMPDKMHGIADPELRRRYRYADLIASSLQVEHEGLTTREVFERRAKLISGMRRFLDDAGYIEVETPMLTPKATGAAAKPFETHHNALDIPLYARIAPELYLKRLTVGGFEKVYELNRNFRNEGLSQRHNPEFTMLEFYCAYMDVNGMMDFCEKMLQKSVIKATGGSLQVRYGEREIDFSKFQRITMKEAVAKTMLQGTKITVADLENPQIVQALSFSVKLAGEITYESATGKANCDWEEHYEGSLATHFDESSLNVAATANRIANLFEIFAENTLIQPTFIIDYPKSISPLSKASPTNPNIAERFELFINGMECANGFSELNDPLEQYQRFADQMNEREKGDDEAMVLDEDYIRALSYGMPPAAGIGIGIDRLTMLLTDKHSIRDVILFPHMRPVVKAEAEHEE